MNKPNPFDRIIEDMSKARELAVEYLKTSDKELTLDQILKLTEFLQRERHYLSTTGEIYKLRGSVEELNNQIRQISRNFSNDKPIAKNH